MAQTLLSILADFDTQLADSVAIGDTTATIASATDDDGVALPAGTYGFTIDAGNSSKEYIIATVSSTALTAISSINRQGVTTSGFVRGHRRGAKVTVTDWAILSRMLKNLNGTTGFNSLVKLGYDADPSITSSDVNKFATVQFVNDTAIAGAPDATETTKGITKLSVAAASPTNPIAVGDNDGRVPTQGENDALVGNNTDIAVGTGNKFVTQTGLQKAVEVYAATTTGNDTYAVTLSPVPTSLVNGMMIRIKVDVANTGAATLNVNSLGALSIVTGVSTALATGDIVANQVCVLVYNSTGTVWQLINPASVNLFVPAYTNGTTTKEASDSSTTQNIAHGLGKIPKYVKILAQTQISSTPGGTLLATTAYNGTTQSSVSTYITNVFGIGTETNFRINSTLTTGSYNTGVVTFDATNIIITWTRTGATSGGNYTLLWEAQS